MKKVVIMLSTYNGEKYLSEQLDSLVNQTYKNIEILIRDDGSKDNTVSIIEKYMKKYKNIRFIKGENKGFIKSFLLNWFWTKGWGYKLNPLPGLFVPFFIIYSFHFLCMTII